MVNRSNSRKDNTRKKNKIEKYINNPHDKIVRDTLSGKREGVIFLNNVLKLKEPLKTRDIENYTNSYVNNALQNRISDVVYKIEKENMYIIIEHQTKKDEEIASRLLEYKSEILKRKLEEKIKEKHKAPKAIGIVLYTGKGKWQNENNKIKSKAKNKIQGEQGNEMTLDEWKTQDIIEYELVDAKKLDAEKLMKEKSLLSKILLIERLKSIEEAKILYKKIMRQNISSVMKEKITIYMIVLMAQNLRMPQSEVSKIIKNKEEVVKMQVDEMLQREARRLRKEGRAQGITVGEARGEAKGRIKEKITIVKNLILNNVQDDLIEKSVNISNTELKRIKQDLIRQNA